MKAEIMMPLGHTWRWHWVELLIQTHGWSKGAELGVKEGRFTNHLLSTFPTLHMIAVDLWDIQPGNDSKEGGETYEDWDNESYYKNFCGVMKSNYLMECRVLRMYTHEAAKLVKDNSLDFVFIDADHSFEGVSRDIQDWKSKVKEDGVILGHDYSWPSVQKAIKQEFNDPSKVFTGLNNCWGIWKQDI